jgi:hypothetical protein
LLLTALFLEQTDANLLLQTLHVLGHRRLRARQMRPGASEAVVIDDGDESAQQFEV